MKVLVSGRGGAGSWTVRGEQLGKAIGAQVKPNASRADARACDLALVVKRTPEAVLDAIRAAGVPWVFDVVDFYPQPLCSSWDRSEAVAWVRQKLKALKPSAVIWPNKRMAADCEIDLPSTVLPHHHRPGLARNPIRPEVKVIGYEGAPVYLDAWRSAIEAECAHRGWRFLANPTHLAELDIVLALRGGQWDGYPQRHWKSNVKLANAHGSGTPFVGQPECGYLETASGAEYWAEDARGLRVALDWLTPQDNRLQISERFIQKAYPIEKAAGDLKEFLCCVAR